MITEARIRAELKDERPAVYYIAEGKLLSPAAREYLQQIKVEIDYEKNRSERERYGDVEKPKQTKDDAKPVAPRRAAYIDYESGASYDKKPEHMTQLFANQLVYKSHPRILFRGKLDKLQADVVYAQAMIAQTERSEWLLADLTNILNTLREMMRCEVLDEPFEVEKIIGLTSDELRDRSHHPMKYYKIKSMMLPDYTMGVNFALLNALRASVRELEVLAVKAFKNGRAVERADILKVLNRLSSAVHIVMCKYLSETNREN